MDCTRFRRKLEATKGIDCGLSFDIDTVFKAAIDEAVDINR